LVLKLDKRNQVIISVAPQRAEVKPSIDIEILHPRPISWLVGKGIDLIPQVMNLMNLMEVLWFRKM